LNEIINDIVICNAKIVFGWCPTFRNTVCDEGCYTGNTYVPCVVFCHASQSLSELWCFSLESEAQCYGSSTMQCAYFRELKLMWTVVKC